MSIAWCLSLRPRHRYFAGVEGCTPLEGLGFKAFCSVVKNRLTSITGSLVGGILCHASAGGEAFTVGASTGWDAHADSRLIAKSVKSSSIFFMLYSKLCFKGIVCRSLILNYLCNRNLLDVVGVIVSHLLRCTTVVIRAEQDAEHSDQRCDPQSNFNFSCHQILLRETSPFRAGNSYGLSTIKIDILPALKDGDSYS
jgi:hypothetical protein